MVPALASREPGSAYLFYDCQTDDARLVLTVLGEAERFGAVMLNGAEVIEVLSSAAAPPASLSSRPSPASGSRSRQPASSTRPEYGPTASVPRRSSRRRTCRGSLPAAVPI